MENEKYEALFSSKEAKVEAFNKIAELFYDKNFSSATKSEVELLMFSIYMDASIKKCKRTDGTIDYNACSDYEMGKELGIPQEKVRSLKIKKQARYPENFDWKKAVLSIKENIRYDEGKGKIIIPLRDPNLYNEVRNYIENHGGYIEIQRSGNIIQIRPEYFFMLMYEDLGEKEKKSCRKELENQLQRHNKANEIKEAKTTLDVVRQVGKLGKISLGIFANIGTVMDSPLMEIFKQLAYELFG